MVIHVPNTQTEKNVLTRLGMLSLPMISMNASLSDPTKAEQSHSSRCTCIGVVGSCLCEVMGGENVCHQHLCCLLLHSLIQSVLDIDLRILQCPLL